uniref:Uncharacterized protein n=1 Tax=Lactuca sativa TaxID=4236 RepID=A0A9R1UDA1_LACSA|nr:hypothetical protein LSAT_V11C900481110 [Lactuca sativa]
MSEPPRLILSKPAPFAIMLISSSRIVLARQFCVNCFSIMLLGFPPPILASMVIPSVTLLQSRFSTGKSLRILFHHPIIVMSTVSFVPITS